MSDHLKPVEAITRPDGVLQENHSDGSTRFSGNGGGVLWFTASGEVEALLPGQGLDSFKRAEALLLFRERLLHLAAEGHPWISERDLSISDPRTWSFLLENKEELLIFIRALMTGEAQFFRSLGEELKPTAKKREQKSRAGADIAKRENSVLSAILEAAEKAGTVPTFDGILSQFRGSKGNAGETTSQMRDKLKRRGFEWICAVGKSARA